MAKSREKITKSELSVTINLKELFGRSFKGQDAIKQAVGQAIIDRMVERTESGKSVTGRSLKSPYSKEYASTLEFKAAGKSRGRVNMTLTGDMLRSIDVLDETANTIKIGIDDPSESPKAFNHQVGDTVPKRPFFGVTKKELNSVKKDFKKDIEEAFRSRGERRSSALESLAARILSGGSDGES